MEDPRSGIALATRTSGVGICGAQKHVHAEEAGTATVATSKMRARADLGSGKVTFLRSGTAWEVTVRPYQHRQVDQSEHIGHRERAPPRRTTEEKTIAMKTRLFSGLLLAVAVLTAASRTTAAEPAGKEHAEAKKHFQDGLYLAENGAYAAALAEFERAYELVPSRLVLFHTALAYVAMDKPVDAVETLDDVLSADGTLGTEYIERAKVVRQEQQQRIGELDVKVNLPATIQIDGEHAGDAPLKEPLKVAAGAHVVCVVAPGYAPARRSVGVAGEGHAGVDMQLEPTESKLAHVTVHSPVPGVEVRVDDVLIGKTPFAEPVLLLPGKHVFDMRRAGYKDTQHAADLVEGVYSTVAFDPAEEKTAGAPRGRLRLLANVGNVEVTIDGHDRGAYHEAIELPAGPHTLKLERTGYESLERMATVASDEETDVKVSLRPTAETRGAIAAKGHTQQNWAIAALATGVALAGGSTVFTIWSNRKLSTAQDQLGHVQNDADSPCKGLNDTTAQICAQRTADAQNNVDQYRNLRLVGYIGIGVGAALVVTGVVLLLTEPNPDKVDAEKTVAGSLQPVISAGPEGASLWLSGRF